jgi:integrase
VSVERRRRHGKDGKRYNVWRVRWYAGGRERSRTFDRAADAQAFEAKVRALKRKDALGELDAGQETLAAFAEEWWELHAKPNLSRNTLEVYARLWNRYALPKLGGYRLRELTPSTISRFRIELERNGVGREAIRKTMTILQGMLQRAVEWERIVSNPAKVARKPPVQRQLAVRPLPPLEVEQIRSHLIGRGRPRDAVLVSVLAYAGLRPQEAVALRWHHVRERTLLIEEVIGGDGELRGQKAGKPPRTVDLLQPLKQDLTELRLREGRPKPDELVFPRTDDWWLKSDWRNWRRRVWRVTTRELGMDGVRPYDLRHSFASLLIHEGRLSIVEIAQQLGHNPNTCLSTYAHVMAELRGSEKVSANEQIRDARERVFETDTAQKRPKSPSGPQTHHSFGSTKGSPESDSNRRPLPYHGSALPTELSGRGLHPHSSARTAGSRRERGRAAPRKETLASSRVLCQKGAQKAGRNLARRLPRAGAALGSMCPVRTLVPST